MTKIPQKLDNDWLTMKEAAAYLRISLPALYQWVQRGKIETVQIVPKGRRLVSASTIEKLLKR